MDSKIQSIENRKYKAMRLEILDKEHAEIVIDQPGKSVNVLSREACEELHDHLAILKAKKEIKTLLIYSAKPGIFLAGADINEIQSIQTIDEAQKKSQALQDLFNELDELPQVTMVAIDGACMGGGTELSLACDYRVCSDNPKTSIGLPEVKLGILPGAGGTQRLPRLVSLTEALPIMLTGSPVNSRKAKKIGLIDDVMPVETMIELCRKLLRSSGYKRYERKKAFKENLQSHWPMKNIIFWQSRKQVLKATKGQYPAPLKILDVVEQTLGSELKAGLLTESRGFAELAVTNVSKNLIHIFFSSEELKKESGVLPSELGEFKSKKIKEIGVVGAGIMGGGIAAVASKKKINVRLKDIASHSLATALATAQKLFDKDFQRKRTDLSEFRQRRYRIEPSLEWSGFSKLSFVIEAVIEKMEIKKSVFQEIENLLPEETIIASNTSSLSISEMASVCRKPERVVGMHFFNPVPMMPLVEVVRAEKTSPQVVAQTVALAKQLGKTPIVVKDRPGFLINRILMPFLIECAHLKQDGFSIQQIDHAATKFGMPMGPFRLLDEIGLDTAAKVADVIAAAYPHMKVMPMIHDMVAKGYLGKKNGKGFYEYDTRGKEKGVRSEFQTSALDESESTTRSIQDRLILPMATEAIMALEEGIVGSVRDLDIGLIFGIGFPPFRGGLLKWISDVGEREILDRMNVIHNATKGRLIVPTGLNQRVQSGQKFYSDEAA